MMKQILMWGAILALTPLSCMMVLCGLEEKRKHGMAVWILRKVASVRGMLPGVVMHLKSLWLNRFLLQVLPLSRKTPGFISGWQSFI